MNTEYDDIDNLEIVKIRLTNSPWLIACLCAAWCDTCQSYRKAFEALRSQHPNKTFAWIDIEDHSDLVDELDIENFPTILIQYEDTVFFLGTMLPDANLVNRLLTSLEETLATRGKDQISPSIQDPSPPSTWSLRRNLLNM